MKYLKESKIIIAVVVIFIVLLIIALSFYLLPYLHFSKYSLDEYQIVANILESLAIGTAALIGAAGVFPVIDEWIRKKDQRRERIKEYKTKYPLEDRGKTYEYLNVGNGEIHLRDIEKKLIAPYF